MTDNIASRAMLVQLGISQWTARRLDRSATAEVTSAHAAASDAGRFNKQIVDKSALLPIQQVATAARTYLYQHTLPWADNGDRVLSSMNYFEVMTKLREFKAKFDEEVDTFCTDYNEHRERARLRLNSLFKDEDYPQAWEVRSKFAMSFGVMPLPTAGDFRVAMSDDVVEEVRQEIEAQLGARVQGLVTSVYSEIRDTLLHLKDRLNSSGKLHESVFTNVMDLMDRLPGLNVTDDKNLAVLRADVLRELGGITKDAVRDDPKLRNDVVARTESILATMKGLTA